ncbi:MAG TPA: class A beta-lactamase [Allosphingosinicella sp.]|nr:class A beta-lactamase [Allosphingosinicella sp.]
MRTLFAMGLMLTAGLAEAQPRRQSPERRIAALERAHGGRLGVALIDAEGRALLSHRANERFAMCSTFKLLLGAMHADTAGARHPIRLTRADLLPNSPYSEAVLDSGDLRVGFAAEHIVTVSDNTAANLLLRRMGGPEAFTRRLRDMGDTVTRLDRYELALNENARGDPRDTTSPAAFAASSRQFIMGDLLHPRWRDMFRGWMVQSRTGLRRIRAGLPAGWSVGDKTGTCGNAVNDVAFFRTPAGNEYILAVYHDRPRTIARGETAIAEVARVAAGLVR